MWLKGRRQATPQPPELSYPKATGLAKAAPTLGSFGLTLGAVPGVNLGHIEEVEEFTPLLYTPTYCTTLWGWT